MTLKRLGCKSTAREWYEWILVDWLTGRELDRGGASKRHVAYDEAEEALAAFERRLVEGPPTELVEVDAMSEMK
jgi:hypothetical protein